MNNNSHKTEAQDVSLTDAARLLNISIDDVKTLEKKEVLQAVWHDGKTSFFSLEDIEKIKSNKGFSISQEAAQVGIQIQQEITSSLSLLRKVVLLACGGFLLYVFSVAVFAVLFILFPLQTASWLGYIPKNQKTVFLQPKIARSQVLAAATSVVPRKQFSLLQTILQPVSKVSLGIVKVANPTAYSQVAKVTILDTNDVLVLDSSNAMTPLVPIKVSDASLEVTNTGLITNLNSQYLQGKKPGTNVGDLAVIGANGGIDGPPSPTGIPVQATTPVENGIVLPTQTPIQSVQTPATPATTITGLTNANLSGSAGITNANLANFTITIVGGSGITVSGAPVSLGGNIMISNSALAGVTSITGTTNQVLASAATGAIALSLPQDIGASSSPSFSSLNLTKTSNQLVLGTTNTGTLSWSPSTNRVLTLPDATDTLVGKATTDIFSNKTIAAGVNTISGLTAANLTAGDFSSKINSGTYAINISGNAATATSAISSTNFSGSLSGDVSGTQTTTSVDKIKGAVLGTTTATSGNLLIGSGTQWITQALSSDATINSSGVLTLKDTGTAGTYGSALTIPVFVTDAQGRVTGVTNTTIAGLTTSNFGSTNISQWTNNSGYITPSSTDILTNKTIAAGSNTISGLTASNLTAGDFSTAITSGTYAINISGNAATATSATSATTATNFSGSLAGDVTGTQGSTTVAKINGSTLGVTTPTVGNVLIGNGASWITRSISNDATIDSSGVLSLKSIGTSGTYGSSSLIPVFTTDSQGRISAVTNTGISGLAVSNFASPNISQWTNNSGYITASSIDALTNKTIAAASNTISGLTNTNLSGSAGITNANLANSAVTINTIGPLNGGGAVSLGGALTLACPTCIASGGNIFTLAATSGSNSSISQGGTVTLSSGSNITTTNNGTGTVTIATSATPTFTTINGVTIINNGSNTLNIASGKTLTASNALTFTGTDGTSFAFPATSDDIVGRTVLQTLTNKTIAAGSNTISGITAANLTAGDFSSKINAGTYSINISGSAGSFTGSLAGDVTGTQGAITVAKINGNTLGLTTPTSGNLLIGSGTQWITQALSNDATINSSGVLTLKNTGTAGTYGSALTIPVFVTDAQGRVTGVTNTTIAGLTNTNLSGFAGITNANLANSSITVSPTVGTGISVSGSPVSLGGTVTISGIDATAAVKGVASFNPTNFSVAGGAVNTIQNINTGASPSFAGLTLSNTANQLILGTTNTTIISSTAPLANRTATIPALTANDMFVFNDQTAILTNKTIAAGSNIISGLTNSNLSGSAGITNANLANSSLFLAGNAGSGTVSLGGTLTLTGAGITNVTASGSTLTLTSTEADTLQSVYGRGNTITTTTGRNIAFTLPSGLVTPTSLTLANNGTADSFLVIDAVNANLGANTRRSLFINPGVITQNTAAATGNYIGLDLILPALALTSGTALNGYGMRVTTGNVTQTAGTLTENGLLVDSTSSTITTGGALNGIKINGPTTLPSVGTYNNLFLGTSASSSANTIDQATIAVGNIASTAQQNFATLNVTNGGTGFLDMELLHGMINYQGMNSFSDDFTGNALDTNTKWTATPTGGGSSCNLLAGGLNGLLRMAAGGAASRRCELSTQPTLTNGIYQKGNNPIFETKLKIDVTTNVRIFTGFTNTAPPAGNDTNVSTQHAYIEKLAVGTQFQCVTDNGGATETTTSTGVTMNANTFYRLRVELRNGTTPETICTIDDGTTVTRTVVTATLPLAASAMDIYLKVETANTTAKNMDVDYVRTWQDDPVGNTLTLAGNPTTSISANNPVSAATVSATEVQVPSITPAIVDNIPSASPSGTVVSLVTDTISNVLKNLVEFFGNVIFHADVTFLGHITFNKDTAGHALIKAGESEVSVIYERVYAKNPVVTVSINLAGSIKPDELPGYAVYDSNTQGFKIKLSKVTASDLYFSWIALAVNENTVSTSGGASLPIVSPTPTLSSGPDKQILTVTPLVTHTLNQEAITPTISPKPTETIVPLVSPGTVWNPASPSAHLSP